MASYFVVGAAISTASHEQSWNRIASGDASPLDWLFVITAIAAVLSGVVFVLGRATITIAMAWISYCVFEAFAAYPFWAVKADAVTDSATVFLGQVAVAGSLVLYITHTESRE